MTNPGGFGHGAGGIALYIAIDRSISRCTMSSASVSACTVAVGARARVLHGELIYSPPLDPMSSSASIGLGSTCSNGGNAVQMLSRVAMANTEN